MRYFPNSGHQLKQSLKSACVSDLLSETCQYVCADRCFMLCVCWQSGGRENA